MNHVRVITVGLGHYPNEDGWEVPEAAESRALVAETLTAHGAVVEDWTHSAVFRAANGSYGQDIHALLTEWAKGAEEGCFIYWSGHAECSDDGYFLALADSTDLLTDGLPDDSLARHLSMRQRRRPEDREADWVVLVIDACGSVEGARRIWSHLAVEYPNTAVVGTSAGDGTASAGAFARVFKKHLDEGFPEEQTIKLEALLYRVGSELNNTLRGVHVRTSMLGNAVLPRRADQLPPGLTTTVDAYRELKAVLEAAPEVVRNHFFAKAQGAEINELAWHFTGREPERRQLAAWLKDPRPGMRVVTGVAGSGKSALLGMVLASSDPHVLDALEDFGYHHPAADLRPPEHVFGSAIHLSGLTIAETITSLADALDLPGVTDADELTRQIRQQRDTTAAPPTLLIDALDESRDALTIASLLRRLTTNSQLRLLVGTRQSLNEDPDHPTPPDRYVLDSLGATDNNTLVLGREPAAIDDYLRQRLRSLLREDVTDDRIRELAGQIVAVEDQPFLFARLAAYEIAANPAMANRGTGLDDLLRDGHSGIFAHTVQRLGKADPPVEALLHALAYARGNGYPRTGRIWEVAGSALADRLLNDQDVDTTIATAAPYLLQSAEFGHTVYRLAHRTFTEWYRLHDDQP